jgi:hypothetical protein
MEVLQSQSTRPRLQQRRSSRSSHSRSPSPWNVFSSACHRQEGPLFEGLGRPFNTRDDDDDRVYDNDGHARRDGYGGGEASEMTRDDSAWEVLSDRRASFEEDQTRNPAGTRADGQEDEDEATMLGRSIPGSYVKPVPGPTLSANGRLGGGRYETLKSWKSADNGATGTRGWMEKSTSRYEKDGERMNMQDFGSNHGVHSRNGKRVLRYLLVVLVRQAGSLILLCLMIGTTPGHKRTTSLTKKSFESLKAMTASFSLPTNLRKRRFNPAAILETEMDSQVQPGKDKRARRSSGNVLLNRAKSMIDVTKKHERKRSSPFVLPSPGSTRYIPYTPPEYRARPVTSMAAFTLPTDEPVVGVPQRHSQHADVKRGSTIRIVDSSAVERDRVGSEDGTSLSGLSEGAWMLGLPTQNKVKNEGLGLSRSPSPPASSMLPPLRQSTMAEDMTGLMSYLDTEIEHGSESEEEQEELMDEAVPTSGRDDHGLPAESPTSSGFKLPGAYPSTKEGKALSSSVKGGNGKDGNHFAFGSSSQGVSNDQFAKAGEDLLRELNAKLMDRGVAGIGQPLSQTTRERKNDGTGIPLEVEKRVLAGKYDRAHQKEFSK